jgi:hypothetical protein
MRARWPYVKLLLNMNLRCIAVGNKRQGNAEDNDLDPGASPVPKDQQLPTNILGVRGERATQIMLQKMHWLDYKEQGFQGLPELTLGWLKVDAKSTDFDDPWLKVKLDDLHDDWAYVLAAGCDHPYWWFPGWLWGREIRAMVLARRPGTSIKKHRGEYWCIEDIKLLHPMYELQQIYAEVLKQEQEKKDAKAA